MQATTKILLQRPGRILHTVSQRLATSSATRPTLVVNNLTFPTDDFTNIPKRVLDSVGENLHLQQGNPLNILKLRTESYFYNMFRKRNSKPVFSIFDNISPIVSVFQNFNSLLIPDTHVSRSPKDTYYVNKNMLLRSHTSAHQHDLMSSGLDAFLVFGDVYRRDEVDATHYPCFHQVEGVRLYSKEELFANAKDPDETLTLFSSKYENTRSNEKQELHSTEASKMLEYELKSTLEGLVSNLFPGEIEYRWVETYFPFTHPSWELEIKMQGQDKWMEMLGCGIIEQKILENVGAGHKVGYAFGLGLERWAMILFGIPDIRLFWSKDNAFLTQFKSKGLYDKIVYKPISVFPPCISDLSFWLPENGQFSDNYFYDLVREVAGDNVEEVRLIDRFVHPKTNRTSHCYRIVYRSMTHTLKQEEANEIHRLIQCRAVEELQVQMR